MKSDHRNYLMGFLIAVSIVIIIYGLSLNKDNNNNIGRNYLEELDIKYKVKFQYYVGEHIIKCGSIREFENKISLFEPDIIYFNKDWGVYTFFIYNPEGSIAYLIKVR